MNFDCFYDVNTKYTIQKNEIEEVQSYFKKKSGWVYIAKTESMPYLKIGRTSKNPFIRAKSLSSAGVINDYEIIYSLQFLNQIWAEKETHNKLKTFKFKKEFFAVNTDYAIEVIKNLNSIEEKLLNRFFNVNMAKESILNIGLDFNVEDY